MIRAQKSPYHWPGPPDPDTGLHRPLRPFTMYQFTPNLSGVYSMSVPQIVGDHQIELSTLRNHLIDSLSANINGPVGFMDDLDETEVREAFAKPQGKKPVPSNTYERVEDAVSRLAPGYISLDMGGLYDQIRSEAQAAMGLTDISAAQQGQGGLPSSTATGASIIAGEQNKRIQLLLWLQEEAAGPMGTAGFFDAMDRQFGLDMLVDVEPDFRLPPDAKGITPTERPAGLITRLFGRGRNPFQSGQAKVEGATPERAVYELVVDSGAPTRSDQTEAAQRTLIAADILANNPAMAPMIDWTAMTRVVLESLSLPADMLMTDTPPQLAPQVPGGAAGPPPLAPAPPNGGGPEEGLQAPIPPGGLSG